MYQPDSIHCILCFLYRYTADEIRITEVLKAIKTLKNNKAPGIDNITPEVLKHGGPDMAQELCHLFNIV